MKWLLAIALIAALVLLWRRKGAAQQSGYPVPATVTEQPDNAITGPADSTTAEDMAQAIAQFEGFFKPGSLAQRTHNPGDIGTYGGNVASFGDDQAGWDALTGYITSHADANPDWDFYDFFRYYLTGDTMGAPGPNQDPDSYADYVAGQLGVPATTPVSQVLG